MSFIDSLTPQQPVNKGLAYTSKPLYPELIGMMQQQKKQDLEEAKFKQKAQKDDLLRGISQNKNL